MTSLSHARRMASGMAVATTLGVFALAPGAHADPYTGTPPPQVGGVDNGPRVLGESLTKGGVDTGPQVRSGSLSSGRVDAAGTGTVSAAGNRAGGLDADGGGSRGSLPITGTDAVQLAAIGLGAVGAGVILVRKGRKRQQLA